MKKHDIFSDLKTDLENFLKEGARKLIQQAIENEVQELVDLYKNQKDEKGRRIIKKNGYLPSRQIQTGLGNITVEQPRVRGISFTSAILPKYMRRLPSIDALTPALYLKGISTGDMQEALQSILGENAKSLSATNIVRLKESWETEYSNWNKRDLSKKHYVYIWADGIYFNVRLTDERPCILVLLGATEDGSKELVAIYDGMRESKISWKEMMQNLKRRGLAISPHLAIGDGALGFLGSFRRRISRM